MRRYVLKVSSDTRRLSDALKALSGMETEYAGGEVRKIMLDYCKACERKVEALIRVSYKPEKGRKWSDVYFFLFKIEEECVVATVKRVSGLGRTDPDFIVDRLLEALLLT